MSSPAWRRPLEIIRSGFRACGQYCRAWRELRRLPARRTACEKRLTEACRKIGAAGGESATGSDLTEFEKLSAAREQTNQADGAVHEKLALLQAAQTSSSKEIGATSAALEEAKKVSAAASASTSAAHQEHQAAQSRLTALEEERRTAQTRREELSTKVTDARAPVEEWQARLTAAQAGEADLKAALSAAHQKEKESTRAATAAGEAADNAARASQSAKAKLEKILDAALGSVAPDRDSIIHAARGELEAATDQHEKAITAARARHEQLTQYAREALAHREAVAAAMAETGRRLEDARNALALRTLSVRVGELDVLQPAAAATLTQAAETYRREYAAGEAATEAQQRAQAAADDAMTRGKAAVAAAKTAHDEAVRHSSAAGENVSSACLALGKALFERGIRPESAGEPFAEAEAAAAELAQLDAQTTARRQELETAKKPAVKTVLGALAAVAVLTTAIMLLTKCSGGISGQPPRTNAAATVPSGREQTPEELCRERLSRLAKAVHTYKLINDKTPQHLSDLFLENFVESVTDFSCPASGKAPGAYTTIDEWTDFTLAPLPGGGPSVVREKAPHHGNGTVLAAFEDGSTRALPAP